ncbi:hypothetical protein CAOG_06435 [Capsaspora owczarzaki ATCC 30864]|nr:hypothetical protein CAOG_06435 [Capsaspora owczarzaki ATCC 30864]|eukprot:XP_004345184.1 hypothetical protein CAOG_06435 [Capsaspora owczarzaki ATCC 30864]
MIAKILIEEKLGLPTNTIVHETYATAFASLGTNTNDFLLEAYPADAEVQSLMELYVNTLRSVVNAGPSGVIAETGWFIPEYLYEVSPLLDSYTAIYDERIQAIFRLSSIPPGLQLDNSTIRSVVNDIDSILAGPACNVAVNASALAEDCAAAVQAFTTYMRVHAQLDEESTPGTMWTVPDSWQPMDRLLVENLGLNLNVTCPVSPNLTVSQTMDAMVGVIGPAYFLRQPFITYAAKPHYVFADNSPARFHRMQLPEYDSTCNISSSANRCGYPDQSVIKLISSGLAGKNPVVYDFAAQFSYSGNDQSNILGQVYFGGQSLEEATCEWVLANFAAMEPNLPDPSRLVSPTSVSSALRIAFVAIACFEVFIFILAAIGVFHYRRVRVILSGSPTFLLLMLLGAVWSMFWIILNYQEELSESICMARIWARHLGFVLIYGALFLKTYRIASVFNTKSSTNAGHLTDRVLLFRFVLIVAYGCVMLVAWSVSHPPQVTTMVHNNESYEVCEVTWWDNAMYIQELIAMFITGMLCYRVRKAPSAFNGSKRAAISVYNWIMVGVILQIILNSTTGPADFYFAVQSLEVLITVPITMLISFVPKFYLIARGKGDGVATSTYNPSGSHRKTPSGSQNAKAAEIEMSSGHDSESENGTPYSSKAASSDVKALRHENARLMHEIEAMRTQLLRMHNPHAMNNA